MKIVTLLLTAALALLAGACSGSDSPEPADPPVTPEPATETPRRALAELEAKSGSTLDGTAAFTADGGVVTMEIRLAGVKPGEHAVHLHEIGDCSADDATSAGGHWNPATAGHGKWGEMPYHRGDIGNLVAGEDGIATLTFSAEEWSIGGDPNTDVIGRAVVVHAAPDDFTTQPTGAAGARIGCGVIAPADAD